MRIQIVFVLLLLIAATATSVVWREFASARSGDGSAQVLVLVLTAVGTAAFVLTARIVVKVQAARDQARRRPRE